MPSTQTRAKKAPRAAPNLKQRYFKAERCYLDLRHQPAQQRYRDRWQQCIDQFQAVYQANPDGAWAAAGLYMAGELYLELYKRSFRDADKASATKRFKQIIAEFPSSSYRTKARAVLRDLERTETQIANTTRKPAPRTSTPSPAQDDIGKVIEAARPSQPNGQAGAGLQAKPEKAVTVSGLRFWSNPNYTRVVIDADGDTQFSHRLLKKDPSIRKPQRLYVDLSNSRLGKDLKKIIPIDDNLLSDARAGQYTHDEVRVVVDIKSFKTYKIFSLKNPFRIVIDVWGGTTVASRKPPRPSSPPPIPDAKKIPPGALAKQLALGVSRIVVDPGHGGRDYGAPGYLKGIHEKQVVLSLGKRLAQMIREELKCEVVMTRSGDKFLTLEERTAIANTQDADLFISLHTNALGDRRAYGIETYFLNLATDDDAIRVAARENATSAKNISDLDTILNDLMQNAKINESSRLAGFVQNAVCRQLKQNYSRIRNKGVKQAPFYVLIGAQMPAILIETSFISNPRECKRLTDPNYQKKMCEGIVKGIRNYIKATNPTAFIDSNRLPARQG
jgi:N-acetylmuramoyl-L-alanine amidase